MDNVPIRSATATAATEDEKWLNLSAIGATRSSLPDQPLSKDEVDKINRYWHATLYLCLGKPCAALDRIYFRWLTLPPQACSTSRRIRS